MSALLRHNDFPSTKVHKFTAKLLSPLSSLLVRFNVDPNYLTALGMLFAVAAGISLGTGSWSKAICFILLNGLCDILDGELARRLPRRSQSRQALGYFLDPAADRISDICFFLGLLGYITSHHVVWLSLLVTGALAAHLTSSWIRAKIESLGHRFHRNKPLTRATLQTALIIISSGMIILGINHQCQFLLYSGPCTDLPTKNRYILRLAVKSRIHSDQRKTHWSFLMTPPISYGGVCFN